MESKNFALANCTFALTGASEIAERLAGLLTRLESPAPQVDLELHFVSELGGWQGQPYVRQDHCEVGEQAFRLLDRVWHVQMEPLRRPARVTIAPRHMGLVKGQIKAIKKTWRGLLVHGRGGYIHPLKRLVYYVYMPMIELALLRKASTFVHCSAIERDGRVTLFPASGGVGKTSLMGLYIDEGWKFLADDMCAIAADGTAHLHPLPLHIYKFHEVHSPTLVARMRDGMAGWDRLLWSALGKIRPADELVRWVPPEQVLGAEGLTWRGRIAQVVYMHRHNGASEFAVQPVAAGDIAGLMASVLLDEIHALPAMSILVHTCRSFEWLPNIGELYQQIRGVLASALQPAKCYMLTVPQKASVADIHGFIRQKGLLER